MNAQISLGDIFKGGVNIAKTSFGRGIIGNLAQPIFTNLREEEIKRLEAADNDEAGTKAPENIFTKLTNGFKNKFAYGDLFSLVGLALMGVQSRLFPTKSEQPGFFETAFRVVSMALTFGGSISATFGRMLHWDKEVALGDDYVNLIVKLAEQQGKKIFTIYDEATKAKLKVEAAALDKVLVYPDGVRESILERHEKNDIGGLLDGKPGTGKTAGVKCILGKWAQRIEKEGSLAEIAELNLANFDEYLKEVNRQRTGVWEAVQAGLGESAAGLGSLLQNQGILVLELLIRRIQKLKTNTDKYNVAHPEKPKKLAIFVDEFDKIFDPRTLQGCDKSRLKNLLLQFNELFVNQEILLTSNRTLEEMMRELKKHLQDGEDDASIVWGPMYDRLAAKNKVSVPEPGPNEQAEMIAGHMLEHYASFINWQDFGIAKPQTGSIEADRKVLAEPIKVITNEINAQLNGRHIQYAVEDLMSMLAGRAREIRSKSKTVADALWDNMSAREKIARTGALIDKEMIKATLLNKASNMKLSYSDINGDFSKSLINNYLALDTIKSKFPNGQLPPVNNVSELHALLATIYKPTTHGTRQVYMAQAPVMAAGGEYMHFIYQHSASEMHSMTGTPGFSVCYMDTKDPQKKFATQKLDAEEIIKMLKQNQEDKTASLSRMVSDFAGQVKKGLSDAKVDPSAVLNLINGLVTQNAAHQ